MRTRWWMMSVWLVACGGAGAQQAEVDHASGHPGAQADRGDDAHGGGQHAHGPGHHHDFSDVERFAAIFDDPERDEWQRPRDVLGLLELSEGAVVADVGAGTGYFAPHLSSAVGAGGRVFALDVEEAMVAHMRSRFAEAGLDNVEARQVATDDPGLEPGSVDRILIVDTWHHIGDRGAYAAQLARALRPGGFVLVIDFTEQSPHGPPAAMRLDADAVRAELEAGGLSARIIDDEALPYQYAVRADLTE